MKKLMIAGLAVAGLCFAGCDKKSDTAVKGTNAPASSTAAALPAPGSPDDVVVTVGDAKLTRGELDADVAKFIEARRGRSRPSSWRRRRTTSPSSSRSSSSQRRCF